MRMPLVSLPVIGLGMIWLVAGCGQSRHYARKANADPGRTRFETYCAGCHLNEGPYMMGEAPPLEGSSWVAGPEDRLIKIVLHGLRGAIEVRGKNYNQQMPGFAPVLTDADIAALLTHLRTRFGVAGPPVTEAAVAKIRSAAKGRADSWTAAELLLAP